MNNLVDIIHQSMTRMEGDVAKILTDFFNSYGSDNAAADGNNGKNGVEGEHFLTEMLANLRLKTDEELDQMLGEVFTALDDFIFQHPIRRESGLKVDRKSTRALVTSIGTITFKRRLYHDADADNKPVYLVDRVLGLDPNERMTNDCKAMCLAEAVKTSYNEGGRQACAAPEIDLSEAVNGKGKGLAPYVSKATVMNLVHSMEFASEKDLPALKEKKVVPTLYIDADEDHEHLQYREHKGDIVRNENGSKNNSQEARLVYVYEGVEPVVEGSNKRYKLINPHYFSGTYDGAYDKAQDADALWNPKSQNFLPGVLG